MSLNELKNFTDNLTKTGTQPLLFVGHGSPMNGIENNLFTQNWQWLGQEIEKPQAVLCISAHWLTDGTHVTAMAQPRTIHDFRGFPDALYQVQYPAPGHPALAKETADLITLTNTGLDHDWGIDHGTWSFIKHLYPDADIPVLQLSIDINKPAQYHYELAKELVILREKGVLVIGSGNMVHNLKLMDWGKLDQHDYGFDWAIEMNERFKKHIIAGEDSKLINYQKLGAAAHLAIPSADHYLPLIYILSMRSAEDDHQFFNDNLVAGSLTMTSVIFGH